jgi:hypothetical protein
MCKMRRLALLLIPLLLTSCRFYDLGERVAAAAILHSVVHMQERAPLTQSAARTAIAPPRTCRLISPHARLFPVAPPKALRRDAKRSIELCRSVFKSDNFRQLYQRVLIEKRTETHKKLVRDLASRRADRVCVFKYGPFFG